MCDRTVWEYQIRDLSGFADCCVPDHGPRNSLPAMAAAILAQAPPTFALAGHSMGGRVAFEVFRQAPDRVERLAIFDSKYQPLPAGEAGEQEREGRYKLLAIAKAKGVQAMAQEWVQGMVHPDRKSDPELIPAIVQMFGRKSAQIFEAQITALLNRPDAGALLEQIRVPTLILCGKQDSWSPPAGHVEMSAQIPSSQLVVVEESGHMVTMERPDEVSKAMRAWLTA
jgi:pimeloyl-ACP methyl ester carboxylesterase